MWSLASTIPPRENPSAEAENTNSWWVRGLRRPECNQTHIVFWRKVDLHSGATNARTWPGSFQQKIVVRQVMRDTTNRKISAYSLIVLLLSGVERYWGEDKPVRSQIVSRFVLRLARNPFPLFIFGSTLFQVETRPMGRSIEAESEELRRCFVTLRSLKYTILSGIAKRLHWNALRYDRLHYLESKHWY